MNDDRRCTARNRAGAQCGRAAITGGNVCSLHGGKAPQVQAKARERLAEAEALRLVDREDIGPITDPYSALADLAGEVVALKDVLREKVNELEAITSYDRAGREEVRAVLGAYERSLDRCARVLVEIGKLTLTARMFQVEEAQAELLGSILAAVMGELTVPPATWQPVVAHHLRALGPGS